MTASNAGKYSLKRKGQRITNSGAREGEEASAACCLLIMQRDQHEQNEWTDYKGQHRQHLSAKGSSDVQSIPYT